MNAPTLTTIEDQLRAQLKMERDNHNRTSKKLAASIRNSHYWKRRALAAESALARVGRVLSSFEAESPEYIAMSGTEREP